MAVEDRNPTTVQLNPVGGCLFFSCKEGDKGVGTQPWDVVNDLGSLYLPVVSLVAFVLMASRWLLQSSHCICTSDEKEVEEGRGKAKGVCQLRLFLVIRKTTEGTSPFSCPLGLPTCLPCGAHRALAGMCEVDHGLLRGLPAPSHALPSSSLHLTLLPQAPTQGQPLPADPALPPGPRRTRRGLPVPLPQLCGAPQAPSLLPVMSSAGTAPLAAVALPRSPRQGPLPSVRTCRAVTTEGLSVSLGWLLPRTPAPLWPWPSPWHPGQV